MDQMPPDPQAEQIKSLLSALVPDYLKQPTGPPALETTPEGKYKEPLNQYSPWEQAGYGLADLLTSLAGPEAKAGVGASKAVLAGVGAKTANTTKLKEALAMMLDKRPRGEIWRQTGWELGPSGHPKFEIPDAGRSITDISRLSGDERIPIEYVLAHPELYDAYPSLKKITVGPIKTGKGTFYPALNQIDINPNLSEVYVPGAIPGVTAPHSTMLHEIQHAIQMLEDQPEGGALGAMRELASQEARKLAGLDPYRPLSPNLAKNAEDAAWKAYRSMAGEVESRNVQDRLRFADIMAKHPPSMTQDTSPQNQFFTGSWLRTQHNDVADYVRALTRGENPKPWLLKRISK